MNTIEVHNLTKRYGKVEALRGVSFDVAQGEIFGLIGPDGAGKTTLFRLLTSLLLPTEGKAAVLGLDIVRDYRPLRKKVGYMPGRFSLYMDLTVRENIDFFATIFGTTVEENYDLVKNIYSQIQPFEKRRAGALSGGMKQKLALSCALIHKPEILFLDEPTTGVDPVSRKELWDMLRHLRDEGLTIIVSTPYMDEASLCDRIALIDNGAILQIDTPEAIVEKYPGVIYGVRGGGLYTMLRRLRECDFVESVYAFGELLHVTLKAGATVEQLNSVAGECAVEVVEPTIEDCFMAVTAHNNDNKND